jgi:hypothetical protein
MNCLISSEKMCLIYRIHYNREYFNNIIVEQQNKIIHDLNKEQSKMPLIKNNKKIKELKNTLNSLKKLQSTLNAYPLDKSMIEINTICQATLDDKSINLLNKYANNIMIRLDNTSHTIEKMIHFCEENHSAKDIIRMLKEMSSKNYQHNWKTFFKEVIDTNNQNPNLEALQKYIKALKEYLNAIDESNKQPEHTLKKGSTAIVFSGILEENKDAKLKNFSTIEPEDKSIKSMPHQTNALETSKTQKVIENKEEKTKTHYQHRQPH